MSKFQGQAKPVRVLRSSCARSGKGETALLLETIELGPLAILMTPLGIEALRRDLAVAEEQLALKPLNG